MDVAGIDSADSPLCSAATDLPPGSGSATGEAGPSLLAPAPSRPAVGLHPLRPAAAEKPVCPLMPLQPERLEPLPCPVECGEAGKEELAWPPALDHRPCGRSAGLSFEIMASEV